MNRIGNKQNFLRAIGYDRSWEDFVQFCRNAHDNVGGKYYFLDSEPKPNNPLELRYFEKPNKQLKKLQRKLYRFLRSRVDFAECVHGCIKDRSYITNAKHHLNSEYFFLVDIEKFFPTVTASMAEAALRTLASPEVAEALTYLVTYDGRLPTGSPTSPFIANIVLKDFDRQILLLCQKYGLVYSRYVDDLTISSKDDFRGTIISTEVLRIIHSTGFRHKGSKTSFSAGKTEITGVLIDRCRLKPSRRTREKYKEAKSQPENQERLQGLQLCIRDIGVANHEHFYQGRLS